MIKYIVLGFAAILAGILGAYITNYEKKIYTKYFPYILLTLAIICIFSYKLDKLISITSLLIILMILSWKYTTKLFEKKI